MNKPRTFQQLLKGQGMESLDRTLRRSRQLHQVGEQIRRLLGPELAPHCQLANIKGDTMLLLASSTVWATRLRYQIPTLLRDLQYIDQLKAVSQIKVQVKPQTQAPKSRVRRQASMSKDAALCVKRCADTVEDPKLRTALERLAKRSGKSS